MEKPDKIPYPLIVPELLLLDTVRTILSYLRENIKAPQEQQVLWYMFGTTPFNPQKPLQLDRYRYYEQAVAIFGEQDGPRKIDVTLGINVERFGPPHLHIILPSEEGRGAIGQNLGYLDEQLEAGQTRGRQYVNFMASANYQLMITSDSVGEAVLVYHVMRAMLFSFQFHLEALGLYNTRFSGQDLNMNADFLPEKLYARNLMIATEYDVDVPLYYSEEIIRELVATGVMFPLPD